MRTSPVNVVDPTDLDQDERERLLNAAEDATSSGKLDLESLPSAVREQLLFALAAYSRGESVATVAAGKPLTSNEAAKLLGMSRTHLTRLCDEGRIDSYNVGTALRVPADEVMRILAERGRAKSQAREAAATADDRRRARAARAAGLPSSVR
jgi:excisionase family DNA binding protein